MKTTARAALALSLIFTILISRDGFSQGVKGYHAPYHAPYHAYPKGYYGHPYAYAHPPVYVHPPVYMHPPVYYPPIYYGGYYYQFYNGCFYRPYGAYFQMVVPPIGITIGALPPGYFGFYMGPTPYYYFNGIFYHPTGNQYEVVAPPLGAVVDKLPQGSKVKVINGEKYYELNGTYYKEQFDDRNRLSYRVVGTDGVLNTDADPNGNVSTEPQTDQSTNQPSIDKTSTRQL